MTNSQNPVDDQHDAGRENAPTTLQPSPSEQPPSEPERPLSELPGDVPNASSPEPQPEPDQNALPDRLRTKSEASTYVGSYRPSDAQNQPTAPLTNTHHDIHASHIHDSTPHEHDQPPPAYTELPGQISDEDSGLGTNAVVADDGRVNIRINQKSRVLTQIIGPQLRRQLTQVEHEPAPPPPYVPEFLGGSPGQEPPPPLNVVIHVVGSRGDVQPFVALGKVLKETYNHRVRLATHPTFKDFVTENGLEFFSIGGDPAELMAFMVKNPGLMPGFDTLRSGDVGKRRRGIAEIVRGTWRSCIETGDGLGVDPLKQSVEEWMGIESELPEQLRKPFVADAIIANPPSFGHIHCAEKLGIPLHMMFTMPWSPTQQFPHPLANIQASNADASITNYMSYHLVDMLTWQGLGDIINKFRKDSLGLDPISMIWGPGMLSRLKIPYTYCWSPALIPKPKDWAHHISISGFYFLSLAQNYTPPQPLADFLNAGEPPVYIGFGSIVVDDPNAMTKMIFEAVKLTGKRTLVSKGWGGLGADELDIPENVFMLGNCPHDWLFKRVSAVVHHGGAGTTAAGIAAGRPTVVVPFFGDQPFWGAMTARAGAGPMPVPYKDLTAEKLAESINEALKPESLERAQELSDKIKQEQGSQSGAQYFHQMLKYDDLRCAVAPNRPAVWRVRRTQVRLSAKAATVLAQEGELNFSELKLFRPREYETDEGPWDPLTGGATAIIGTATTMMMGVADFPIETMKLLNIHPDSRSSTKSSRKGKERENTSTETGESSRTGRLPQSRSMTNTTQESAASSTVTLPEVRAPFMQDLPRKSSDAPELSRSGSHFRRGSEAPEVVRPSTPNTPTSPSTPSHRSAFVTQALAATSPHSRSRSPSRERFRQCLSPSQSQHQRARSISAAELRANDIASEAGSNSTFTERLHQMNAESAAVTGKGIGRIVGAGFKSPLDFSLNVAKGFRNVPKLYGADVRQAEKVTDFQSGLRTAAKEFGFGIYDGLAGIVTDPYKGAKKEGGVGFVKGVGKGLISVPFRMGSGLFGIPAYAMQGIYQEIMKEKGVNVQNYIIAARISQGYDEASTITPTERADIISRWKCIRLNVKKKKHVGEDKMEALHTLMADRRRKKQDRWNKAGPSRRRPEARPSFPAELSDTSSYQDLSHTLSRETSAGQPTPASSAQFSHTLPRRAVTDPQSPAGLEVVGPHTVSEEEAAERRQFEAAIAASVAEASRGNPEEDELIARAIRASVQELQSAPAEEDDEETLRRAIQASINEAGKSGATEEEQRLLEETLKQSLLETSRRRQHGSDSEWDSSDTEDDEDYQRILAESKELTHLQNYYPEEYQKQESGIIDQNGEDLALKKALEESQKIEHPEDLELKKALEESQKVEQNAEDPELKKVLEESEKAEQERMATLEKQKTEEEIVLEYVMKQSLAEEEWRTRMAQGRDIIGESSGSGSGSGGQFRDV